MTTPTAADTLTEFLAVWSNGVAADIADKLTCTEADAIAAMMRTHGRPAAAAEWINFHSHSDDEGDSHHRTAAAAIMYELDVLTAAYPDLAHDFEDPDGFGAGHIVLYTLDGRQRFAITEKCDKPAADETCQPIGWTWERAHHDAEGEWRADATSEATPDELGTLTLELWGWAQAHGGTRGL